MSGAAAEEQVEVALQRRDFGAQRYRHRCFLLFLPVSTGQRTRSEAGGVAVWPFAALDSPGARRTGRALPTCPESRPVPIPPPMAPPPHPAAAREEGGGGVTQSAFPGEGSGWAARRGRWGNRDSSPSRGRLLAACPRRGRGAFRA